MNKWEWMLVTQKTVDGKSGLVANAQPSLAENV